jgi:hypothetical protein
MADDWTDLFDGETLDGWGATNDPATWTVEDGAIRCLGGAGGYLYTHDSYEDFELELEFETAERANSGVFLRWSDLEDPVQTGLELQVLDPAVDPSGRHAPGALYDLAAPEGDVAPQPGEWHRLRVVCEGPHIREWIDGEQALDVDIDRWDTPGKNPDGSDNKFENAWADMPREGRIGLQDHGDAVRFRDLRVRRL